MQAVCSVLGRGIQYTAGIAVSGLMYTVIYETAQRYLGGSPQFPFYDGDCARAEFQASTLCNFTIPTYLVLTVAGVQLTFQVVQVFKAQAQNVE